MKLVHSTEELVAFLRLGLPDKQDAFDTFLAELGVTFLLDVSTQSAVFSANSAKSVVTFGQHGAERLWAHAFAYSAAITSVPIKLREGTDPQPLSSINNILDKASQILTWAVRTDVTLKADRHATVEELPTGLPSPFDCSDDGTILSHAQGLWCFALMFILLHELHHIKLKHVREKGDLNVQQEKEVDRLSAEWLIVEAGGSKRLNLQRRLGVATALLYLATYDVYLPGGHGQDYPPGYDRLFQTLTQFFPENEDESEQVWAFVAVSLLLHLQNKAIPIQYERLRGTFKNIVDQLVNTLAKE